MKKEKTLVTCPECGEAVKYVKNVDGDLVPTCTSNSYPDCFESVGERDYREYNEICDEYDDYY